MRTHTLLFRNDEDYWLVRTDAMKSGRYVLKFQDEIAASLIR